MRFNPAGSLEGGNRAKRLAALIVAGSIALTASAAAASSPPTVAYRYKIPARVAKAFARDAHIEAQTYGYPVHGCAYTNARAIYGCSVSAPGDWQLLSHPSRNVYYEFIVQDNKITQRTRYRP